MYEHKGVPPIPRKEFGRRLLQHALAAIGVVSIALGIGILGYHFIAGLVWIDSLLEASMILGGMGPVNAVASTSAKLFASFYALFSGLAFIAIAGIMIAPVAHRILHRFHWEEDNKGADDEADSDV